MRFGILQRYVMGEVFRSFALALLTITIVFVLCMVMAEASQLGLTPQDILRLVPYVIPGSLPYTIPVSLLFAVTLVYGRLASDNEIIAVKTAGLSAFTVLTPSLVLGALLSAALLHLSAEWIPVCNTKAKLVVMKNLEESFYMFLRKDRQFDNPRWPFLIKVRDVVGKTMIGATFKHRVKGAENRDSFDMIVMSKTAVINFDMEASVARVYLDGAEIQQNGKQDNIFLINKERLDIPIPDKKQFGMDKRIQEFTNRELVTEQVEFRHKIAKERKRQAISAALWMGSGRLNRVPWDQVQTAFIDYKFWEQRLNEYETERQMRYSMSCGSLLFVLLGAPVGILFARRDFLSAFISCFVPIILVYYPLTLFGSNLARTGMLNAVVALWLGNAVLAILSGFVLPPVVKH